MYGLDGLRSTSAENFMSVALLQIYRLRKLVTCSILIWPAVTPLTFSHSIQHEAVTLDLLLKKKQKKTRRALSRGNSTIYTSPFSESHIIHSHTQKKHRHTYPQVVTIWLNRVAEWRYAQSICIITTKQPFYVCVLRKQHISQRFLTWTHARFKRRGPAR